MPINADERLVSLMALLDVSAALTLDHLILLKQPETTCGVWVLVYVCGLAAESK